MIREVDNEETAAVHVCHICKRHDAWVILWLTSVATRTVLGVLLKPACPKTGLQNDPVQGHAHSDLSGQIAANQIHFALQLSRAWQKGNLCAEQGSAQNKVYCPCTLQLMLPASWQIFLSFQEQLPFPFTPLSELLQLWVLSNLGSCCTGFDGG